MDIAWQGDKDQQGDLDEVTLVCSLINRCNCDRLILTNVQCAIKKSFTIL
jgi:hypothetical protein